MPRLRLLLLMIVLSAFALTPAAAQEATPEVTPEATVEATTDATSAPSDLSLTETFTTDDGSVSVDYPTDWAVYNFPVEAGVYLNIVIANQQELVQTSPNIFEGDLQPGQVTLLLAVADMAAASQQIPDLTPDSTAEEILEALAQTADPSSDSPLQFSDIGAITMGDHRGARLNATIDGQPVGMALAYIEDGVLVLMIVNSAPGELERWEMVALDVIGSVDYSGIEVMPEVTMEATDVAVEPTPDVPDGSALELTEDYVSSDERLALRYPSGWVTREAGANGVYIASDPTALEKFFGDELASGEAQVYIEVTSPSQLGQNIGAEFTDQDSPFKVLQGVVKLVVDPLEFGSVEAGEIGGLPAASVDYQTQGFAGRAWTIQYQPGTLVLVQLITAPDESALWEPTVVGIAESIVYGG